MTVVDLTVNVPGPFCSSILSDLGARVIKIEPPGGDPFRHSPGAWAAINRGKQSVVVDLKTDGGREMLSRLAAGADIVLEGWRPGVAQRLGADYETLSGTNGGIVYCSISGFGQDGPWRDRPAHDVNYMALSGYLGLQSQVEGRPWPPAVLFSDLVSGLYAAINTLAVLAGRGATGQGAYIDLSMTDAALSLLGLEIGRTSDPSEADRSANVTFIPHYGLFECADGSWLSLGIVHEDHFWQRLCDAARLDDLAAMDFDERLAEAGRIEAMLSATFVTRTAAEWERELLEADVPVAVVAEISEIFDSPQFRARAMFGAEGGQRFLAQPARLSGARVASTETAPRRGEHADAVLSELGYTAAQVEALRRDGVLGEA